MRSASTTSLAEDSGPGFRGILRVSFGHPRDPAGEDTGGRPRRDLHFDSAHPGALPQLRSAFAGARVGVRLVLAGPPADIHAAAAAAAECGLVDEEITLLADGAGPRVVVCGHCHAATPTSAAPGSEVDCQGCATAMAVSDHFSRRRGAYLGFAARAEEPA